ncbi:MAG: hypothetical protein ISS83_01945 [Candidatus Pacebacteria bacterium]|nr:hypothetical protein [Candidatus Paceibacterota bacterium]
MPKSSLEIFFSPEGLIILPFAVLIDLIGIILVCFGLDDFWITDIIAWMFLGGWSFLRSQIIPAQGAEPIDISQIRKGKTDFKKQLQEARRISKETKTAQKGAKAAKWGKRIKWLEFIPYVGALPLWSVSVYMTIKYS